MRCVEAETWLAMVIPFSSLSVLLGNTDNTVLKEKLFGTFSV
jgi:hypothetical protein